LLNGHVTGGLGPAPYRYVMQIKKALATALAFVITPVLSSADTLPDDFDVYLLGEVHDNPRHHLGQAAMIEQIQPKAVVFEQLSPRGAAIANTVSRDDLTALGEALDWDNTGWPPFRMYAVIFDVMGDTPAVGMAKPFGKAREAFALGAAETFGTGAEAYGLTSALATDEQAAREQLQFDAHCAAMPIELMPGMVEAQRYRDAAFARTILEAVETYGSPVAVILGHGHARNDWAVPRFLNRVSPDLDVFSVGFVEIGAPELPFDLQIATEAPERGDPCAALAPKT